MRRVAAALSLVCLLTLSIGASAQQPAPNAPGDTPRFKDYPVQRIFKGKPAKPWLTAENRQYYSAYYESAAEKGVSFAGHYAIVTRGCGSACVTPDILDLQTGKTVKVPFSISGWRAYHDAFEPIETRPNSRLIVFLGARNESLPLGYHYYVLENGKLKFLRTVENDGNFMEPLAKE
jgi:hypothetical protein